MEMMKITVILTSKWRLTNFSVVMENCRSQELCSSFILFSYPSSLNCLVSVIWWRRKAVREGMYLESLSHLTNHPHPDVYFHKN
jgi:hypothetical protein